MALVLAASACRHAPPQPPVVGVTVDAPCDRGRCAEGLWCRLEGKHQSLSERCVLQPGRCRDDWDCARSVQRCRRFGNSLGVCQDAGL
jgi:hypothetical protein